MKSRNFPSSDKSPATVKRAHITSSLNSLPGQSGATTGQLSTADDVPNRETKVASSFGLSLITLQKTPQILVDAVFIGKLLAANNEVSVFNFKRNS